MPQLSPKPPLSPSRAAQYVRMSTEHQQYSPQNQADTIAKFAVAHNMEIVSTYDDHGRPEPEVVIVRDIFSKFVDNRLSERELAFSLNEKGILSDMERPWTRATIHQILTNPKYVGTNVYNRRSFKLKMKRLVNPPDMWVSRDEAFEAIVPLEVFLKARKIIDGRHIHLTDDDLLERLQELLRRWGKLSGILIDEAEDMPSSSIYASRFGGLHRAYELIGWNSRRDFGYIEIIE
jgi:Recombinase/Resolvase, N terminal domain